MELGTLSPLPLFLPSKHSSELTMEILLRFLLAPPWEAQLCSGFLITRLYKVVAVHKP